MAVTTRVERVAMIAQDAESLARFYAEAFGFAVEPLGTAIRLRIGQQQLELRQADAGSRPCPASVAGPDPAFQHIALVTPDIGAAVQRLNRQPGWRAISSGPITLPAGSGGVTAFKFFDPEGHPLEFLQFVAGKEPKAWQQPVRDRPCLGYDHTAISVRDLGRTLAFYEPLGLKETARTLNVGPEQDALDDVRDAHVDVLALTPSGEPTPHLELLHYRARADRSQTIVDAQDGLATRTVLAVDADTHRLFREGSPGAEPCLLRDPDGHFVELVVA